MPFQQSNVLTKPGERDNAKKKLKKNDVVAPSTALKGNDNTWCRDLKKEKLLEHTGQDGCKTT